MTKSDVVVVGGGIMGCASALALSERGVGCLVLERSVPGAEASSAAAGILGAQVEAHGDGVVARLGLASRSAWEGWAKALVDRTGIDVGYRHVGVGKIALEAGGMRALEDQYGWQAAAGLSFERLDGGGARAKEPALCAGATGALWFADDGVVDPPTLLKALRIAAERAGARFQTGSVVRRIVTEGARARGVELDDGSVIEAGHVVLAAGSWSSLVDGSSLGREAVRPARGQIVELVTTMPPIHSVLFGPRCYLVPRVDGRVLIGSTLELVGFRPGVTAGAVRDLLTAALELVPGLASAAVGRAWSSFRPMTPDRVPLLGTTPIAGLLLATGHFRNGILHAPITGEIVAALVTGTTPPVDISPFSATRLPTDPRP